MPFPPVPVFPGTLARVLREISSLFPLFTLFCFAIALLPASLSGSPAPDPRAGTVLGQPDYFTTAPNFVDLGSLKIPFDVAIDRNRRPNRLYVSDYSRDRIFCYLLRPGKKSLIEADRILKPPQGEEPSGPRRRVKQMGVLPRGFLGLAVNRRGDVLVADSAAERIIGYRDPFADDDRPDVLVAGPDMAIPVTSSPSVLQWTPRDIAADGQNRLYVCDASLPRVLILADPFEGRPQSLRTIDTGRFASTPRERLALHSLAFGPKGHLYVQTGDSGLVLVFEDPMADPLPPPGIFDFSAEHPNDSYLGWIAVDPQGRLWAPRGHDVLHLASSIPPNGERRESAVVRYRLGPNERLVSDRSGKSGSRDVRTPAALGLSWSHGMDFDSDGNAYVCDPANHRIAAYIGELTGLKPPDFAIGQGSVSATKVNVVDGRGLDRPNGIAVCRDQFKGGLCLAVADTMNSRVLVWRSERHIHRHSTERTHGWFDDGQAASRILGQPGPYSHLPNFGGIGPNRFDHPFGVGFSDAKHLVVADTGNNRVVAFVDNGPDKGFAFECVFGQPDEKTREPLRLYALDETTLNGPRDFSGGFVADFGNHRLIEVFRDYRERRALGDVGAVLGQQGLLNSGEWNRGGIGAAGFAFPRAVARSLKGGHIFVADFDNHRVLVFHRPKNQKDWNPIGVLGQGGDFNTREPNKGGVSANSLRYPADVATSREGELYVADMGNHRVLRFPDPLAKDPVADLVIGQGGDFKTRAPNKGGVGRRSLRYPSGVDVDEQGHLYIADTGNNRVLIFGRGELGK